MSELSAHAELFPSTIFITDEDNIATSREVPDMLKAWELDPHFRNCTRAIPISDFGEEQSYSSGLSHFHESMWQLLVVEEVEQGLSKSVDDVRTHYGCPERPHNLMKTHLKLKLAENANIHELTQAINLCLDSFSEYDFSYIEAAAMWRGKYLQGSRSCVLHIHLYCDISAGDHRSYIIETKRVSGEAKPFHEFFKEFKSMMTNLGGAAPSSSSSGSNIATSASEDDYALQASMFPSEDDFPSRPPSAFVSNATTMDGFHTSPSRFSSRQESQKSVEILAEVSEAAKTTSPTPSSSASTHHGNYTANRNQLTPIRTDSFVLGKRKTSPMGEGTRGSQHSPRRQKEEQHLLLHQNLLYIPPPSCRQTPKEFLESIEPIVKMAESPYYEVKLEAARILCDITSHDHLLLGESECVARICRTLELLIQYGGFKAVKEQAIITLARFVDISGYDRYLVHSDILPILFGFVSNPSDLDTAFETAQLRRECARTVAILVTCDVQSVLRKLQSISLTGTSSHGGQSGYSSGVVPPSSSYSGLEHEMSGGNQRLDAAAYLHAYSSLHRDRHHQQAHDHRQRARSEPQPYQSMNFSLKRWLNSVDSLRDVRTRMHAVKARDILVRAMQK